MLSLEDQVCAIEHAKRFDEIGITQKSLWYWCESKDKDIKPEILQGTLNYYDYNTTEKQISKIYSAFTVAELGKMLPEIITKIHHLSNNKVKIIPYDLIFIKHDNTLDYSHITCSNNGFLKINDSLFPPEIIFRDTTEANARAKMLIYLLENKLITAEEINKCLG